MFAQESALSITVCSLVTSMGTTRSTNSSCTSDLMHTHNGQETVGHCLHEGIVVGQHRKETVPRSDPNHLLNSLHYVTTHMIRDSPGTSSPCCL